MLRWYRWSILTVLAALAACGGGGASTGTSVAASSSGGSSSSSSSSSSGGSSSSSGTVNNVAVVTVGNGPLANDSFNIPYTSIKVCIPNTTTCKTINNILVDTGSVGLRIMASTLQSSPALALTDMVDPRNGANTLGECLPFADGYTWGPLVKVDVSIAGETAANLSVNIIDDSSSYAAAPAACTTGAGTSLNSVSTFDANGILGVGLFDQDCGTFCMVCSIGGNCGQSGDSDIYYSCTSAGSCQYQDVDLSVQVRNPVALFAADNNGVVVVMPTVATAGAPTATGSLIFGIGTRANNALGSATVLTTNSAGEFTTTYNGKPLNSSFIDSGSNGYYFASSIAICSGNQSFYCPNSLQSLTATDQGLSGTTVNVNFQIANLNTQIANSSFAINDVGGGVGGINGISNFFDWGMPFFYGRSVFNAIEGASAGGIIGPYVAF